MGYKNTKNNAFGRGIVYSQYNKQKNAAKKKYDKLGICIHIGSQVNIVTGFLALVGFTFDMISDKALVDITFDMMSDKNWPS